MDRAYGICQFDYRYDLVGFMRYAYETHPKLWPVFSHYLTFESGNSDLQGNAAIGNAFLDAMKADYVTAVSDQLTFLSETYWRQFYDRLNAAGFRLDQRHIAVSAAMLSVNVNCGPQAERFICELSSDASDAELISEVYRLRNTMLAEQMVGSHPKGTTDRYRYYEPQLALDLLYGYVTIDSDIVYGGGVEWHGNPFSETVTTKAGLDRLIYQPEPLPEETAGDENDLVASPSDAEPVTLEPDPAESPVHADADQEVP